MAPFGAAMMLSLLALTWFSFPARDIVKTPNTEGYPYQRPLLLSCVGLYAIFPAVPGYRPAAVWAAGGVRRFLLLARRVLLQIDWSLILCSPPCLSMLACLPACRRFSWRLPPSPG